MSTPIGTGRVALPPDASQLPPSPSVLDRILPDWSVWQWFFAVGIAVLCLWVIIPIYLIGISAVSTPEGINAWPKNLWPAEFSLETLDFFFSVQGVFRSLLNSILVAVMTMILSLAIGAPAGYALARYRFRGKNLYRLLILMMRAFPIPILALPLTVAFLKIGLYDTLFAVALVHTALTLPFAVLISSNLFMGIPFELEEAAWTLGCSRIRAFTRVVLPIAMPGLTAAGIFAFVISWNEVFAATILTGGHDTRTLSAFLLTQLDVAPLHFKFAGGFFMIVPALVFIFAVRKYLFSMWGIANR